MEPKKTPNQGNRGSKPKGTPASKQEETAKDAPVTPSSPPAGESEPKPRVVRNRGGWTPARIIALIVAVTGLITAATPLGSKIIDTWHQRSIERDYQEGKDVNIPPAVEPPKSNSVPIPKPPNDTTPPPAPVQTLPYTKDLYFQGGWKRTGKDNEMDTDGNDQVPVRATTILKHDAKKIWIEVKFSCTEDGGNKTAFSGTQTKVLVEEKGARTIVGLHYVGPDSTSFRDTAKKQTHGWRPFPTAQVRNTYWDRVGYVVDTPFKDDSKHVGIIGKLSFQYDLKSER